MSVSHDVAVKDMNDAVAFLDAQISAAKAEIKDLKQQVADLQAQLATPTLTTDEVEGFVSAINAEAQALKDGL